MKQIGANSNQTQNDLSYRKSKPTQLVGTRRQQEIAQYKAAGMAKTKPNVAIITPPISSRYSHQRLTNPADSGAGGGKKGSGAGFKLPLAQTNQNTQIAESLKTSPSYSIIREVNNIVMPIMIG